MPEGDPRANGRRQDASTAILGAMPSFLADRRIVLQGGVLLQSQAEHGRIL
jgi:hypothetical protein